MGKTQREIQIEDWEDWRNKCLTDPFLFFKSCWPDDVLYSKQAEIVSSVLKIPETCVRSCNQSGKTRISAMLVLWFFCTRYPARVIASSSSAQQLDNALIPEVTTLIRRSRINLQIVVKDKELGWENPKTKRTYEDHFVKFFVTTKPENFQGSHLPRDIPRILVLFDEASGVDDVFYETAQSFAHRILIIGNPMSTRGFFYRMNRDGDKPSQLDPSKLYRKVIHISAKDTPNVRRGLKWRLENKSGVPPIVIPGLVDYEAYLERLSSWNDYNRRTRLDGEFFDSDDAKLIPKEWIDKARSLWRVLAKDDDGHRLVREPVGPCYMGIDVAEGGRDLNVWCVLDALGIVDLYAAKSEKDKITQIADITKDKIKQYGILSRNVLFDRGAGGLQHAGYLARDGFRVRAITFQESAKDKKAYLNRRAEMYGMLRQSFDPRLWTQVDGQYQRALIIPPASELLREELEPIPWLHDGEGKMYMLPKRRKGNAKATVESRETLEDLIGRSPDCADALALANYARVSPLHPAPSKVTHPLVYVPGISLPKEPERPEKEPPDDPSQPRRIPLVERLFGPGHSTPTRFWGDN